MRIQQKKYLGWGRFFRSSNKVYFPSAATEYRDAIRADCIIARGGGRSYGDAALNSGASLICMSSVLDREMMFDNESGVLKCPAALTQKEVINFVAPQGWILPSIPGSREITLGGKIAADAHGKNHYATGTMIDHVLAMTIMLADGTIVRSSRLDYADLFWATAGGLGLTGVIVEVEMQLKKIPSVYTKSAMTGFDSVDELYELIEAHKDQYEFILGWANGRFKPGWPFRGAVSFGNSIDKNENGDIWNLSTLSTFRLPFPNPLPGAGWMAALALNWAISRKFRHGATEVKDINHFFFPQDAISNWNIAFGYKGFVEYHCCFPLASAKQGLKEVHAFLCAEKILCSLVALKRFGPAVDQAPLSFPQDGYSLALDMPVRKNVLEKLKILDDILYRHGGRVNPVKDSRLPADMMYKMYPRIGEWLKIKRQYDPEGKFSSDMSRRLGLEV